MRQIMEKLLTLQKLQLDAPLPPLNADQQILRLRKEVPAPVLGQFDRLITRGKKGVAIARNGTCGGCHLRLPSGTIAALAYTNEVHVCDYCGRYLYLPEDEPLGLTDSAAPTIKVPAKSPAKRIRQKADLHVA